MLVLTPRRRLRAAGALATLSVSALTAGSMAVRAEDTPKATALSSAKTIQLKETFSVADKTGKLSPYYAIGVQIERAGKARIDLTPLAKPTGDKPSKPSFYLADGTKQYEYNGFSNKYTVSDAAKPDEQPSSQLWGLAGVDLILHPGQKPPADSGIQRTVGNETLDGHAMTVTTDTRPPRKQRDGSSVIVAEKVWTDTKTGLPFRRSLLLTQGGKTTAVQQWEFSDWTFDKPIPSAQLVWAAPEGATEFVAPKLLAVGAAAPDFTANSPDGKAVKLSDLKGKVVILDFWATWCGPCQQSMPHLEKVYQQVKDKNVAVLAVCVWDEKAEYDKWVVAKKGTFSFPTVFDPAGRGDKNIAGGLYGVSGIPTQYVIDKDGKVAAVSVGYDEGDSRLETALAKLGVDIAVPKKVASAK